MFYVALILTAVDMALELRDELQTVQVHLNSFLISAETAMEERIR